MKKLLAIKDGFTAAAEQQFCTSGREYDVYREDSNGFYIKADSGDNYVFSKMPGLFYYANWFILKEVEEDVTVKQKDREKVKLTKAQADALESALKGRGSEGNVVLMHCNVIRNGSTSMSRWMDNRAPLNDLDLDTIVRALYYGYEVEKTQEERHADVLAYFKDSRMFLNTKSDALIIQHTLNLLDIKIKGINTGDSVQID